MARIVVADDDPLIRRFFEEILKKHTVISVDDGVQAWGEVKCKRPDLVLMDQHMPNMNGVELADRLQIVGIPFVFVTADSSWSVVQQATEIGALGYILKRDINQFDIEQLLLTIEITLARGVDQSKWRQSKSRNTAVGIIMCRSGLNEGGAFSLLRSVARNRGLSIDEAARLLVAEMEASVESFRMWKMAKNENG